MASHSPSASTLSPEYALLGFLIQKPAHGYELHQRLMTDLGQVWHVSLSQTYNILNRLETQGFITGSVRPQAKLPPRRQFRLTAAGRRHFKTWLHSPTPSQLRVVRLEFTTRLYFADALDPTLVPELIEAQITEAQTNLNRLQAILGDLPAEQIFNRQSLKLRIRQLTFLLDWLADWRTILKRRA